jgi:hypothetical protein
MTIGAEIVPPVHQHHLQIAPGQGDTFHGRLTIGKAPDIIRPAVEYRQCHTRRRLSPDGSTY